jgi:hypothetical protein
MYKQKMNRNCKHCDKLTRGEICQSCNKKITTLRLKIRITTALGNACKECGLQCRLENLCCFDAHHTGKKSFKLSDAHKYSWHLVKEELTQCELLCAMCHRLHHKPNYPKSILEYAEEQINILAQQNTI